MDADLAPTRILIIDTDEASFQIRQCIAQALSEIPPVELFHARDATEALNLLESLCPDVIVIDDEEPMECDLFIDSLCEDHPPIIMCTESCDTDNLEVNLESVTYIPKSDSLDGFHQTIKLAAALGIKAHQGRSDRVIH